MYMFPKDEGSRTMKPGDKVDTPDGPIGTIKTISPFPPYWAEVEIGDSVEKYMLCELVKWPIDTPKG